jgi:hypothetical protein
MLACPGVVRDLVLASKGGPASLAATPWQASFSPVGRERSLVPEEGLLTAYGRRDSPTAALLTAYGRRDSPTAAVVVQGSSEGGAVEPSADGGESRRPQGASNSHGITPRGL